MTFGPICLFFAFADMFRSRRCWCLSTAPDTHQDQGSNPVGQRPFRYVRTRKSSVPGRVQVFFGADFMVVNQPLDGSRPGRQRVRQPDLWSKRPPNQTWWFCQSHS